jgi:hypothetical protein
MLFGPNIFHDVRLVRPSQIQGSLAPGRDHGELGNCLLRYWLAVPANRWGSAVYAAAQLKTIQEVITLIAPGAYFIFHEWS